MTTIPSPKDLRFPYEQWRAHQDEAIEAAADSKHKVVFLSAPTGSGKSGIAMALSKMLGPASVIVTQTKSLQQQYLREFRAQDLNYLIGRDNYRCILDRKFSVSEAPCQSGWRCPKMYTCDYFAIKRKASEFLSPVITNYAYYLGEVGARGMLSHIDTLVLDEGHEAENALMAHVNVTLERQELKKIGLDLPMFSTIEQYRKWATNSFILVNSELVKIAEFITQYARDPFANDILMRRYRMLRNQQKLLHNLEHMVQDDWILDVQRGKVSFRPLWVKKWGNMYTFTAEKTIIQSATIVAPDKMADLLGITDWEYIEVPSLFAKERRPFYYYPVTPVGMRLTPQQTRDLIDAVDEIIDNHPGEAAIIHTVNYTLRDLVVTNSKHSSRMLTHTGKDRDAVIEDFLDDAAPPRILVSPSVMSGLNASYHRCGFQIIMKVPFADRGEEQVRRRLEEDPEWYSFNAACKVVQAYGRAMRYDDDYGETYMLDANFGWFYRNNIGMFPKWMKEAVTRISTLS